MAPTAAKDRLKGVRVLVVDDDENIRIAVEALLVSEGACVSCTDNGAQAVAECLRPSAAIDVVLLDVQMPMLSGLAATSTIRRHRGAADLPIVGLSAWSSEEDLAAAFATGMNEYLLKPFDIDEFVVAWRRIQLAAEWHARSDAVNWRAK